MGACKGIKSFSPYSFRMSIPPSHTASIGTEPLLFDPDGVGKRHSTLTATNAVILTSVTHTDTTEVVPAAE
ncbi:hypothetical protein JCM15765_39970 [Paradesulfitobacterium aromaticivorans]